MLIRHACFPFPLSPSLSPSLPPPVRRSYIMDVYNAKARAAGLAPYENKKGRIVDDIPLVSPKAVRKTVCPPSMLPVSSQPVRVIVDACRQSSTTAPTAGCSS